MVRPTGTSFLVCSLLVLFAHGAFSLEPHRIPLTEGWRFLPGDNPEYMLPGFDDAGWKSIGVDRIWEEQGYDKLDGFAWYRIRFVLPAGLRTSSRLGDGVRIFLGKINNFDQSFLNGRIFGMNGKTVPPETVADTAFLKADMSMWNVERTYRLSVADPRLRWDTVNVLAVRVYDQGGQGGIWTGNPHVRMIQLLDYLGVDIQARPFDFLKNEMRKTYSLRNTSREHAIRGCSPQRCAVRWRRESSCGRPRMLLSIPEPFGKWSSPCPRTISRPACCMRLPLQIPLSR